VCCVVSCELITYNAALNRPAFQSSVWKKRYYRYYYVASLANDGSHVTNATVGYKPRCALSNRETNPWWSVDLGHPATVYRVDFTNRGDDNGMKNFTSFSDVLCLYIILVNYTVSQKSKKNIFVITTLYFHQI